MIYPTAFLDFCANINCKLTSLRKNVLYILWDAGKPLKAYEVLELLLQTKTNSKPPTVYRVLDYFVESGLVHKIESIQCYTLCQEHEKHYSSEILMVCTQCHQVHEIYDKAMHTHIIDLSKKMHFALGMDAVELKGFCKNCLPMPSNI